MGKRVGIFAGSFDPVHDGHIAFAKQALKECGLDKVFFLIEPRPRRKQGVRALEHRVQMVQLAIAAESNMGSILLEQGRFSVDDTLPVLKSRFKGAQLHILLGDDVLNHLAGWPHVEQLIRDVRFIIGVRSNNLGKVRSQLHALERTRGLKLAYNLFTSAAPEYASRQIRLSLKRGHEPNGLPKPVSDYISANGLYHNPHEH